MKQPDEAKKTGIPMPADELEAVSGGKGRPMPPPPPEGLESGNAFDAPRPAPPSPLLQR